MKIWMLMPQFGDYEVLSFSNHEASDIFRDNFRGEPMKQNWTPIQVETYKKGPESDFPDGLSTPPIFSGKAVRVLDDLLNENVELLPLLTESGKKYYAVNVVNVLDCIDERYSEIEKFRNGKIMEYTKYNFQKNVIKGEHIFKIVDHEKKIIFSTKVFVSDLFRNRVLESGLKAFDFMEVWDSEKADKEENDSSKLVPTLDMSKDTYSFEDATNLVEEQKKVIVSESLEWAIRLGDEKQTQIGHLQEDGTYMWLNPIYYPPIFLEMKWRILKTTNNT